MAYKVFTNGSVLQASEINDNLMSQSVAVFSNAAARTAAITAPVEGQVTYLEDSNSYQSYDSSRWVGLFPKSANLIINGAFEINQRNYVSGANLASGTYGFDRWKSNFTNTTLTYTYAPQGQEVTLNSGGGLQQIVERQNIPAGTYTLSWSGTATGRIYNSGASAPSYASSPITVTLSGIETVVVEFTASGSTKTLSNVQLELGSASTPFSRNANTSQGELAACQRYYVRLQSNQNNSPFGSAIMSDTSNSQGLVVLPVTMRTQPTSVDFSTLQISDFASFGVDVSSLVLVNNGSGPQAAMVGMTTATSPGSNRPCFIRSKTAGTSFIGFSAEL